MDDGALVPEIGLEEQVYGEAEGTKEKRGFRKRRQERITASQGREGKVDPDQRPRAKTQTPEDDFESRAEAALAQAKVHFELGDYDFAADELRKISKNSPYYAEAQALLKLLF